ncbi:hypothetical protein BC629DRAFT_1588219 [Irpex lacteus]|nr:hypothetical protein BC629DRAFT_1588219 [Irpex lacteus]
MARGNIKLVATVHCPPHLVIVPQSLYTISKRQYLCTIRPPMVFSANGTPGVQLHSSPDDSALSVLDHETTPLFEGCGTKIAIVSHFLGYPRFQRQKYAGTGRGDNAAPNNRRKVLAQVAEVMQAFLEQMQYQEVSGLVLFGPKGTIMLEDLYLLELQQVSRASFQPVFAVKKELATW